MRSKPRKTKLGFLHDTVPNGRNTPSFFCICSYSPSLLLLLTGRGRKATGRGRKATGRLRLSAPARRTETASPKSLKLESARLAALALPLRGAAQIQARVLKASRCRLVPEDCGKRKEDYGRGPVRFVVICFGVIFSGLGLQSFRG